MTDCYVGVDYLSAEKGKTQRIQLVLAFRHLCVQSLSSWKQEEIDNGYHMVNPSIFLER